MVSRKIEALSTVLREMESVVVAYSGGVDSTVLLVMAREILQDRVLGVTIQSPAHPAGEYDDIAGVVADIGVAHRFVHMNELENDNVRLNPPDRCYHCKRQLFQSLLDIARDDGFKFVVEGTNLDDMSDYRPGVRALRELGIRSPFLESDFTKTDIRNLAKSRSLEIWNKPSNACLYTRIPYNQEITPDRLARVAQAEKFLHDKGFNQVRVRDYGDMARIELLTRDISHCLQEPLREQIIQTFIDIGYNHVTLDLAGYRSGSMNADLPDIA